MDSSFVKISDILKNNNLYPTESPIEQKMLSALLEFIKPELISTQVEIGPYRADILIKSKYKNIVIECDGKEFHQDKERDSKRDRYMEEKGFLVMRFTGTEIHKNRVECAMRICEEIQEVYCTKEYQSFLYDYLQKSSYPEEDENEEDYDDL